MKAPPPDLADRLLAVSEQVLHPDAEVRLEDVAHTVGASRATLYYYFSGREDLLTFLLVAHVEGGAAALRTAIDSAEDPEERLRAAVAAMVGYLGPRPGVCAGLLSALGTAGRMVEVLRANDARIASPVREVLVEGRASGAFDVADVTLAANAVLGGVLMAVLGGALDHGTPLDADQGAALTDQVVRGVLA